MEHVQGEMGSREEMGESLKQGTMFAESLLKVTNFKILSRKTKLRICRSVIRPSVFASETWEMPNCMKTKLEVWKRKMLPRIWWQECRGNMYQEPVITAIKAYRLRQLHHFLWNGNEIWGMVKGVINTRVVEVISAKGRQK